MHQALGPISRANLERTLAHKVIIRRIAWLCCCRRLLVKLVSWRVCKPSPNRLCPSPLDLLRLAFAQKINPCRSRRCAAYTPHILANRIYQTAKNAHPVQQDSIKLTSIKGMGLSEKARLTVGVTALWPSLFPVDQHARNRTGILDRSGGKPAGLRLTSVLRRHAKNNAQ